MIRPRILKAFRVAAALAAIYLLAWSVGVQAAGNQGVQSTVLYNGYEVVPGEILVKFRDPSMAGEAAQEMDADRDQEIGGVAAHRIHSLRYDTETLLAMMAKRADVEYAEPNYIVYAIKGTVQTMQAATQTVPNDPYFNLLWGLNNTGQTILGITGTAGADISATQAWATTTGSKQNVVAVVDTGIDYTHEDLRQNVWSAPSGGFTVTIGGQSITCAAGTHGFNAITNSCDPMDDNGHGTHVSGTIGAVGNNGVGVVGVNWTASIMSLKFLDKNGSGTISDAINAIEFAIQVKNKLGPNGGSIRVLSNSWGGGGYSQTLSDEISKAYANDMMFVAAAGNAGSDNDTTASYPASYQNVVAVAATDSNDNLASWSNYGPATVALGAPGVNIGSTYPGDQYVYLSGTSMATPHVSGVAALVLSACGYLNVASLTNAVLLNTDLLPSLANKTHYGRLDAAKAVASCATTPPPPQPSADFSIAASPSSTNVKRGGSVNFTVTTAATAGSPGPVSFKVSGLPSKASASFAPNPATVGVNSTMTVKTSSRTPRGTFMLTITGTSGSSSHTATVSLTVN